MHKKRVLLFIFILLCFFKVNADNDVQNGVHDKNTSVQISYYTYDYEMSKPEFFKFASLNKLDRNVQAQSMSTTIKYINLLNVDDFNYLIKKLGNAFSNKSQGNNYCKMNQGACGGAAMVDADSRQITKKGIAFEPVMINNKLDIEL